MPDDTQSQATTVPVPPEAESAPNAVPVPTEAVSSAAHDDTRSPEERHAAAERATAASLTEPDDEGTLMHLGEGIYHGVGKSLQGVTKLLNKIPLSTNPSGTAHLNLPIPLEHESLENKGGAEKIGGGIEEGVEFMAGGEALKGVTGMLKVAKYYPKAIKLMEKYPKASKLILGMLSSTAVGGAQGAVKGAAEGDTERQAKAGAKGGAAGELTAGALSAAAKPVARILGLGGLTSAEAMTKAGKPYVKEINWEESVKRAMPRLIALNEQAPFKNIRGFIETLHEGAQDLWQKEIQPQIDAKANKILDGQPVADAIRKAKSTAMTAMPGIFQGDLNTIERVAADFDDFHYKLSYANDFLKTLNAKLGDFYKLDPVARRAAGITDGEITALETAADELRQQIYNKIDPGGTNHADLRKQYGAMKDLLRVFGKRATVEERQAEMNLPMVVGLMQAGSGLVDLANMKFGDAARKVITGVIPAITKAKNSSANLLKRGVEAGAEELGLRGTSTGLDFPGGAAAAGAQAARGALPPKPDTHIRFTASDGSVHDIPKDQLDAAKKIDPELKVIE